MLVSQDKEVAKLTSVGCPPKMMVMPRSPRIIITLSKPLLDALTVLGKRHGLARAAYIRMVLSQHVEKERTDKA